MAAGDKAVYLGFAAAVAAALGAVVWLAFAPAKPAGAPLVTPPRPTAEKPPLPTGPEAAPTGAGATGPAATAPAPPKPATPVVRGVVQDASGTAVPDATVEAFEWVPGPPKSSPPDPAAGAAAKRVLSTALLRDMFYLDPEELDYVAPFTGRPRAPAAPARGALLASTRTDAEGKFEMTLPTPRRLRVEASKAGMSRGFADNVAPNGQPLHLVLGVEEPLRGVCIDADTRAPVAGAEIVVRAGAISGEARSGEDGTFSLPNLPAGRYGVTAGAPGYTLTKIRALDFVPGRAPAEIALGRGVPATVFVHHGDPNAPRAARGSTAPPGPPVAGALVVLFLRGEDTYLTATTGEDGSARFTGLCEGQWRVAVRKEGFSTGMARDLQVDLRKPGDIERRVTVYALVPTPVRVVDTSGAPVAATLYWCGVDDEFSTKYSEVIGRTDASGRITVTFDDGVPRKSMAWVLPENGAAAMLIEPENPYSGDEVTAVARAGRVVRGRVTDDRGRPVAGARIGAEVSSDSLDVDVVVHGYTDAEGRYALPPVPFGDTYVDCETETDWLDQEFGEEDRTNPLVADFVLEAMDDEDGADDGDAAEERDGKAPRDGDAPGGEKR